jgi:hypothetical protein
MRGSMIGLYVDEDFRVVVLNCSQKKVLESTALIIYDSFVTSK